LISSTTVITISFSSFMSAVALTTLASGSHSITRSSSGSIARRI
jgi:hypothetical protein